MPAGKIKVFITIVIVFCYLLNLKHTPKLFVSVSKVVSELVSQEEFSDFLLTMVVREVTVSEATACASVFVSVNIINLEWLEELF